ncbi:MAG: peptidase domain-containing ABC transporter [Synechococcus sp. BS307-5m-G39]|nr:peptidase domain-containing ABC transporter [Synechococcus sp. BS307-5m-G39]MBL6800375.1 peptidase domain-containing ABC transporter [Synechococcus sp. BS307-5m-G37]
MRWFSSHWSSYPCVRQFDEEDCGAACLATVAKTHGLTLPQGVIRDAVGTTSNGTTLLGLRRGAEQLGFTARAARAPERFLDALKEVPLPLICHWDGQHWVVLHRLVENEVLIADPAVGLRRLNRERFLQHWNDGVVLLLEPDPARRRDVSEAPSHAFSVLLRYVVPFRRLLLQALLLNFVVGLMSLGLPLLMQLLTDDVLVRGDQRMLVSLCLGLMLLFGFRSLIGQLQGHLVGYFGQKLQLQMVMHYGRQLLLLPLRYFETHRSGEAVSRIGDIEHVNDLIGSVVLGLPSQFCIAFISLLLMWAYSPQLTLAALIGYVVVIGCSLIFLPSLKAASQELLVRSADNQGFLVELFRGASVLKTSDAFAQAWQEYQRNFGRMSHLAWRELRLQLTESTLTGALGSVITVGLLWYGSSFVIAQELSIGQLLAFNGFGANVLGLLASLSGVTQEFLLADVVIRRMSDVLERKPEAFGSGTGNEVAIAADASICCEGITYNHPGRRPLLQDFSLMIPGGLTTALVGESGCGKSTLSKILSGIYPPDHGTLHYGPFNSQDLSLDCLRSQVVLVPQESIIFNRSIFENFTFAHPGASFEQVVEACQLSLADDFIRQLPDGYRTVLGEFGANLSGGQRQRLAIARALITNPPVLILDEATSALDPVLESRLMNQLLDQRKGRTTVLISHRPSVIIRADWIIYLEQGKVLAENTPGLLLDHAPVSPFLKAA